MTRYIATVVVMALLFTAFIPPVLVAAIPQDLWATAAEAEPSIPLSKQITEGIKENQSLLQGIALIILIFIVERLLGRKQEDGLPPSLPSAEQEGSAPIKDRNVIGFFVNWDNGKDLSWESLQNYYTHLTSLAPFWYSINREGDIISRYGGHRSDVFDLCRSAGISVLPLINNYSLEGDYLTTQTARQRTAEQILTLVEANDYDGINLDLEDLPPWQRANYTRFIRELSRLLRPQGHQLTLSVFPKVDVPHDLHHVYDYQALAPYVDKIVIMAYDRHWPESPPGAIAPISWVEDNIKYALQYIEPQKLYLGMANYGYNWPENGTGGVISTQAAKALAGELGVEIQWDDTAQSPYFTYTDGGVRHTVWFESSYSLEFKLALAEKYGLGGVTIWRLGNETTRFWDILD